MPTKMFINGREVTNPVVKGMLAPFIALMLLAILGIVLLFVIPVAGLLIGGAAVALAGGGLGYLLRSRLRSRHGVAAGGQPRIEEAEVINIEDTAKRDNRRIEE